jgi:RNA recognition motif-containing protein
MIAKSDDRTVVASGLSHEINDDTCFLELFKPFGEVISANLAVRDPEHNRGGLFGFVTFLTKEAAKQAIRTLNGGSDQRIRKVIRAKQINMPPMDPRYRSIPGIFVPPLLWPFVEEMTAKSDDKTVLASNLTLEIDEDTCLLELFKPYGEVICANLAPIDPERNRGALFGFVTFVTKEGAEQAIRTLNGSGPYGWDKRILKVNWAKQST